jgi:hypothetical protein
VLVKAALLFLLAMAALALAGRALGRTRRPPPRLGGPVLCGRCGRLTGADGRCDCGGPGGGPGGGRGQGA